MDERSKQAFESVRDTAKQLITVATGVLALMVTFSKDFLGSAGYRVLVHAAWFSLLFSSVAGIWVLMAVTGTIGSDTQIDHTKAYGNNIVAPAVVQILTFAVGMLLAVIFGVLKT